MKVNKIKIVSFRGIVNFDQELSLKTQVITGPNGTGKSGIIDAFDFLMTGDLQRLSGEGTSGLSIDEHGKHIDKDIKDVFVEAEIVDGSNTFSIKRKLQDKKLELVSGNKTAFEATQEKMNAGQFLLSRRELLKFIACTGKDRSEEIQALLDTSGIERIRTNLAGAVTSLDRKAQGSRSSIETTLSSVNSYLKLAGNADSNLRREEINKIRKALNKPEITNWTPETDIVADIQAVPTVTATTHKKSIYGAWLDDCRSDKNPIPLNAKSESVKELIAAEAKKISEISNFSRLIQSDELVDLGSKLLGNTNTCPLCDTLWEGKNLSNYLKEKKKQSENAKTLKTSYSSNVNLYNLKLTALADRLKKLKPALTALNKTQLSAQLDAAVAYTETRISKLKNFDEVKSISDDLPKENGLIEIPNFDSLLAELEAFKNILPEESQEEIAFTKLQQVAALFKVVIQTTADLKQQNKQLAIAQSVAEHFNKARETVFKTLFSDVESDFVSYYKFLNQDEEKFTAKLIDQKSTVDLKVDFYDRGLHPPHALHSEGHQDSMGICLFLALMKKIKGTGFSFALFDDVMMSIDTGHRKRLCELLKHKFPDTQFVITTHDPVWARQLKEHGVVTKKNLFHFRNWSLNTGPVFEAKDVWDVLKEKANSGLVHDAAAGLRRNLELEFQDICSNLQAQVTFRSSHSWSLGELKDAAIARMKFLLARAKDAANSYSNKEAVEKLIVIEQELTNSIKESKVDEWQLNPSVHYNEWGNFSKEDLLPLINSKEKLINSFGVNSSKFFVSFKEGVVNPIAITTIDGTNYTLVKKED